MYSPKLINESFIQYVSQDNNSNVMFFENRTKIAMAQTKEFDLTGNRIRNVSVQCQNTHSSDVIIIEINGKRVVDKVPLLQSFILPLSDNGLKVKEPIEVTVMSDVTNPDLEVVVLFGVDFSI